MPLILAARPWRGERFAASTGPLMILMIQHEPSALTDATSSPRLAHGVLGIVCAGVVFFGGVHTAFVMAAFLAAVAVLAIHLVSGIRRGETTIAVPFLAIPSAGALLFAGGQLLGHGTLSPESTREVLVRD